MTANSSAPASGTTHGAQKNGSGTAQSNAASPVAATSLVELRERINVYHEAAESALSDALHNARGAGELLLQAKSMVPHGGWSKWLERNFAGSARSAQAYTRIAKRWPEIEKRRASADLSIDGALKLLAVPKEKPARATEPAEAKTELTERERKRRLNDHIIATRLSEAQHLALEAAGKSRREILSLACEPQNIREFRLAELGIEPQPGGDDVEADQSDAETVQAIEVCTIGAQNGGAGLPADSLGVGVVESLEVPPAELEAAATENIDRNGGPELKRFRERMAYLTGIGDALPQAEIPNDLPEDIGRELIKDLRRLTGAVNLFRARVENALVASGRRA